MNMYIYEIETIATYPTFYNKRCKNKGSLIELNLLKTLHGNFNDNLSY